MTHDAPNDAPGAPAAALTAGKLRGLARLADPDGRFRMVAVDQRPPLFAALARGQGVPEDDLTWTDVADAKALLARELAPHASALLLDPLWALPRALSALPGRVGLLSTLEGYDVEVVDGERRTRPIDGWSVAAARRSGADAIKVLAWHRPDVSDATARHQDAFVRAAGEACRRWDLPFVLELLDYPFPGEDPGDRAWQRAKAERVTGSLRHYADPSFGVDLFKLEAPFDPYRVREVAAGALDDVTREPALDLTEARGWMAELDALSPVPWVVLSAGVGPEAFAFVTRLAVAAGASGYLAGRALWAAALDGWPDRDAVSDAVRRGSVPLAHRLAAIVETGRPWHDHPRYGGAPRLAGAGPDWLAGYARDGGEEA